MAKNTEESAAGVNEGAEGATEAPKKTKKAKEPQTAAQAAAGGGHGGGKSTFLTLPDGSTVKRADYIRSRWQEGVDRSQITAEVNKIIAEKTPDAKAVPYQVIFQATKGIPGGPKKDAPAEATSA